MTDRPNASIGRLQDIVRALRDPQTGCPWDLRQDHRSMARHLIEESYEIIDAIEAGQPQDLKDELGDLAFQIVFHAQLADERGDFDLQDIIDAICAKMIERHPHVFGDETQRDAQSVRQAWEARKQASGRRVLAGVPRHMPALQRAERLTSKAATVGFDWDHHRHVLDKIDEELVELKEAIEGGDKGEIEDELGDALFALVNLARHMGVDAEAALRSTNDKFTRRFNHIEDTLQDQGRHPRDASLEEMDALWNQAKAAQKEAVAKTE